MSFEPTDRRDRLPAFAPFSDPERRRRVLVVALAAALWAAVVQLGWILLGVVAVGGLAPVAVERWLGHFDAMALVTEALSGLCVIGAGIAFLAWQRVMIRNTAFLGCEHPDPSPGIATLCWFVPLANLVVPVLSLLQVERWSRPDGRRSAAFLAAAWWTAWLVAGAPTVAAAVLYAVGDGPVSVLAGHTAAAVGLLLRLAAGVLALRMVGLLTYRQQLLATLRAGSPR